MAKFYNKARKYVKRQARKRYRTRTGGVRVAKMARDLAYVKRSLNVEHKQVLTRWGTYQSTYGVQQPTSTNPYVAGWLTLPQQGISNSDRIGNNIVVTHISAKFQVDLSSITSGINKQPYKLFLIFVKAGANYQLNGNNFPIQDLFNKDFNGNISQSSYRNKDTYPNFIELKGCSTTRNPQYTTGDANVASLQQRFYWNTKCRIPIRFTTGTAAGQAETNRPILIMMSDVDGTNQKTQIAGDIKLTYVDN